MKNILKFTFLLTLLVLVLSKDASEKDPTWTVNTKKSLEATLPVHIKTSPEGQLLVASEAGKLQEVANLRDEATIPRKEATIPLQEATIPRQARRMQVPSDEKSSKGNGKSAGDSRKDRRLHEAKDRKSKSDQSRETKTALNLQAVTLPDLSLPTITTGADAALQDLLLAVGNVFGLVNDIPGVQEIFTQLNQLGLTGAPAVILGAIVALSAGKASFLSLFLKPLQIANQVLAIIGIALLGTYLFESEGDYGGIFRRSDDDDDEDLEFYSYSAYSPQSPSSDSAIFTNRIETGRSRAWTDTPIVQRLGSFVHRAIETYEKMNE